MAPPPAPARLTDTTDWQAEVIPPIAVTLRNCIYGSDWLEDAPGVFDTQHNQTARMYETNSGITPCILAPFDPAILPEAIQPGYTVLSLFEKRAVVAGGSLLRLWSSKYEPRQGSSAGGFYAITEGTSFSHLRVGLDSSIPHAVREAEVLSARMNGAPVVVARLLSSVDWH